jgi:hypothetical protein
MALLMNRAQLNGHMEDVNFAVNRFTRNFAQYEDPEAALASDEIFVVRPTEKSRRRLTFEFTSSHVLGLVSRSYAKRDRVVRQSFYKTISRHPWFGSSVAHIFETSVLLWFRHAPANNSLPCRTAPYVLEIPGCREKMTFFSKVDELKKAGRDETRLCLVPVSQSFPTVDAIIITKESVITIQMTVARGHDIKPIELQSVYNRFSTEFLSKWRKRYHVLLTDTEDKARLLRMQKLAEKLTKMDIQLYSAYIEFAKLDSIISGECVDELETERVSIYWLYAINIHW